MTSSVRIPINKMIPIIAVTVSSVCASRSASSAPTPFGGWHESETAGSAHCRPLNVESGMKSTYVRRRENHPVQSLHVRSHRGSRRRLGRVQSGPVRELRDLP
jgi:hypothetical protein